MHRLLYWFLFSLCVFTSAGVAQETRPIDQGLDSLLSVSVSTAAKYKQTTSEAPASIAIVTAADIDRFHYTTLADILNRVCGVYTSNDRNYSYVGIRGFSRPTDYNNRILLLVDGHTVNENVYGSAALGSEFGLPLEAIERIEIVRGPGSALYGAGAMFGVVNVITKDFQTASGVEAAVSAGSYGYRKASLLYGREFTHGSGMFISGQYGHTDGTDIYFPEYDAEATHRGIASGVDWDTYYGITAKFSFQQLAIRSGFSSRKKGIPTGSFSTVFNAPQSQTLDNRQFIDALYSVPVNGAMELSLRLYGDRYRYEGAYMYDSLLTDESTGLWWGSEVRLQWDIAANDRFVVGAEFQDNLRSDYISRYAGTTSFNVDKPSQVQSVFAQNEFQWLEDLALTCGVRFDHHTATGGTFSPRIALNWNMLNDGVVKFLVGTSYRSPNFYELYYEEVSTGYKSNPSLSPELMMTYEVAIEQRLNDHLHVSLSAYIYAMKNLIDPKLDPSDSMFTFQNVSRTHTRGIECEIEYQPSRSLHCYASFSLQKAEDGITNGQLTNSPQRLVRAGAAYTLSSWIEAAAECSYDSERLTVYGAGSPSFMLMHTKLSATPYHGPVKISLGVRNLFDTRVYVPGGFEHLQPMIPQPGRELIVTAACTF